MCKKKLQPVPGLKNYQIFYLEELLSEREIQVLKLIVKGNSNPKIAEKLGISKDTVKAYTEKIYDKLCVENRAQAAVKAVQFGICE